MQIKERCFYSVSPDGSRSLSVGLHRGSSPSPLCSRWMIFLSILVCNHHATQWLSETRQKAVCLYSLKCVSTTLTTVDAATQPHQLMCYHSEYQEVRSAPPWPGPWPLSTCLLGICCLYLCSLTTGMRILSDLHNAISAQQMGISSLLELSITQTRLCFQTHTNGVVPTQGNNTLNWSTRRKTKNSFRPGCLRKFKKVCTQPYISFLMVKGAQRCPHNTS